MGNGGVLDEIVFQVKTEDKDDLAYLEGMLKRLPNSRAEYQGEKNMDFSRMYGPCVEGTICVKIDDDVVRNRPLKSLIAEAQVLSYSSTTELSDPS